MLHPNDRKIKSLLIGSFVFLQAITSPEDRHICTFTLLSINGPGKSKNLNISCLTF